MAACVVASRPGGSAPRRPADGTSVRGRPSIRDTDGVCALRPPAQPAGAASAPLARMRDHSSGIWPGRCRVRDTASAAPRKAAPAAAPRTAAIRAPRCPVSAAPAAAPSTLALRTCCLRLGPVRAAAPRLVVTVVSYSGMKADGGERRDVGFTAGLVSSGPEWLSVVVRVECGCVLALWPGRGLGRRDRSRSRRFRRAAER